MQFEHNAQSRQQQRNDQTTDLVHTLKLQKLLPKLHASVLENKPTWAKKLNAHR